MYSELLADNQGKKYQTQALPDTNLNAMVVPIGLETTSDNNITFTVDAQNLPTGMNVYLEDRVTGTFTLLNQTNADYTVSLEAQNEIGRFYLHTSSEVLSTHSETLDRINIFKTDNATITISGLSAGNKANVKLFNMLGKEVFNTSFKSSLTVDVAIPNLNSGVYIVQLISEKGTYNNKIIIK